PRPRAAAPLGDRGNGARCRRDARGLSLPCALPVCGREMQRGSAYVTSHKGKSLRGLLESAAVKPLLRAERLVKHFRGGIQAVDDVSFDVHPGETFALVGESGCGKSTTGRLVLRLLEPTSGKGGFDGRELSALRERELRSLRRGETGILHAPSSSRLP